MYNRIFKNYSTIAKNNHLGNWDYSSCFRENLSVNRQMRDLYLLELAEEKAQTFENLARPVFYYRTGEEVFRSRIGINGEPIENNMMETFKTMAFVVRTARTEFLYWMSSSQSGDRLRARKTFKQTMENITEEADMHEANWNANAETFNMANKIEEELFREATELSPLYKISDSEKQTMESLLSNNFSSTTPTPEKIIDVAELLRDWENYKSEEEAEAITMAKREQKCSEGCSEYKKRCDGPEDGCIRVSRLFGEE